MTRRLLRLRAADDHHVAEAVIDLDAGGRLRALTVTESATNGTEAAPTPLLADVPDDADPTSSGWGSYPMAPWAGRLRHGRFHHEGQAIRLRRNHIDGSGSGGGPIRPPLPPLDPGADRPDPARAHAIHGTVFGRAWQVDRSDETTAAISCPLVDTDDPLALDWPFAGTARQAVELTPTSIQLSLTIETDGTSFPAVIGWHPWFAPTSTIEVELDGMYEHDEIGLPTGRLITPTPGPWDACFRTTAPTVLRYDRPSVPAVTISSDCDHLVIYDELEHGTCVEPQSGPADAFNLGVGTEVVAVGSPLRRTMTIAW